jgi:hypothetical protein
MNDRNQALATQPACPQPATPIRLERTFDLPQSVQATLLSWPAYELRAEISNTAHGHHVRFLSFFPSARRPQEQVKFQGLFSTDQLRALPDLIDQEIGA